MMNCAGQLDNGANLRRDVGEICCAKLCDDLSVTGDAVVGCG